MCIFAYLWSKVTVYAKLRILQLLQFIGGLGVNVEIMGLGKSHKDSDRRTHIAGMKSIVG